jgi:hypothetical protein
MDVSDRYDTLRGAKDSPVSGAGSEVTAWNCGEICFSHLGCAGSRRSIASSWVSISEGASWRLRSGRTITKDGSGCDRSGSLEKSAQAITRGGRSKMILCGIEPRSGEGQTHGPARSTSDDMLFKEVTEATRGGPDPLGVTATQCTLQATQPCAQHPVERTRTLIANLLTEFVGRGGAGRNNGWER